MFYTVVSGRNGQTWVNTSVAKSMRDVLKQKFLYVMLGDDWIEVYKHLSLFGGRVSHSVRIGG